MAITGCGSQGKSSDADIEKWVMNNPEAIIKSLQNYERKMAEENQPKASMVSEFSSELFKNSGSPVAGNASGKIELAYFFDFRCGHCARQSETIEKVLSENKDVKIVYKVFPVLGPDSETVARGALAAHQQGKFRDFYKEIYASKEFSEAGVKKVAQKIKLDISKFEKDMKGEAVNAELGHVADLAQKMKIRGTPLLAIAPDKIFPGRVDSLSEVIGSL